jgi:hypothetical protein
VFGLVRLNFGEFLTGILQHVLLEGTSSNYLSKKDARKTFSLYRRVVNVRNSLPVEIVDLTSFNSFIGIVK